MLAGEANSKFLKNKMEGTSTETFNCIIAVGEKGTAFMLDSSPSVYEHDAFDGDYLDDNISENRKDIPKEKGIYKCVIEVRHSKYLTDCGYEYDCYTSIKNIEKLDFVF
jgi:hypothetical protein